MANFIQSTFNPINYIALASAFLGCAFVGNNFITHVFDMPGLFGFMSIFGIFNDYGKNFSTIEISVGFFQTITFILALFIPFRIMQKQSSGARNHKILDDFVIILISGAFWSVLLIGLFDATISFLRIEGMLPAIFGDEFARSLGKSQFRGTYFHLPLACIGFAIGFMRRGIEFIWLALLIVLAELLIVFTRFIFSYEQAFMGDLVRFWYAALFLFASAYTLVNEGHVRVDVIYANFNVKKRSRTNIIGSLILGIPLCWVVLTRGLWTEASIFNLSLLNFEVTQQGYGMYVKYIMSSFLIIFGLSMLVQFSSYIISEFNNLENKATDDNSLLRGN